ncbi:beta-2 adrenergic receptor-like [Oculina patagonica]
MNRTTANTTLVTCGLAFLPSIDPANISSGVYTVYIVRTAVYIITCPLIILLNTLVMVAVKSKPQLRTKSNTALACLATTDLIVGLAVQPLQIASYILMIKGETQNEQFCTLTDVSMAVSIRCVLASLFQLFLMSTERYIAIKHTFAYENQVTKARLIIAASVAWVVGIALPIEYLRKTGKTFLSILIVSVILFISIPAMLYFNAVIYKEVRRNEKQIASNQVSLEAKEKMLKNRKAFYTTIIILFTIFLCFIPGNICVIILNSLADRIPDDVRVIVISLVTIFPVLNSLFNPLIYVVRIRYFRVAFIQLLSRKSITQAEELERRIFGSRRIGVIVNAEQEQIRADQEQDEQQANDTLNNGHATTVGT